MCVELKRQTQFEQEADANTSCSNHASRRLSTAPSPISSGPSPSPINSLAAASATGKLPLGLACPEKIQTAEKLATGTPNSPTCAQASHISKSPSSNLSLETGPTAAIQLERILPCLHGSESLHQADRMPSSPPNAKERITTTLSTKLSPTPLKRSSPAALSVEKTFSLHAPATRTANASIAVSQKCRKSGKAIEPKLGQISSSTLVGTGRTWSSTTRTSIRPEPLAGAADGKRDTENLPSPSRVVTAVAVAGSEGAVSDAAALEQCEHAAYNSLLRMKPTSPHQHDRNKRARPSLQVLRPLR